jgi:hypothetical protein
MTYPCRFDGIYVYVIGFRPFVDVRLEVTLYLFCDTTVKNSVKVFIANVAEMRAEGSRPTSFQIYRALCIELCEINEYKTAA